MSVNDLQGPGRLKARDGEPPFLEAWHAQVTAMANLLVESKQMTAESWAEALGAAIRASSVTAANDDADAYFTAVLSALEGLLAEKGTVSAEELHEREHAWERAYLRTPHGKPVTLD